MATRVTLELTAGDRRRLALDLLPEMLSAFESALFTLQERHSGIEADTTKAAIRETLLELLWEIEKQTADPDEGLALSPETEARLRSAGAEPRISLEDIKREIND